MAGRQRFGIGHVEAGGADLAAFERRDQGVRVDDLAARDVDEVDVLLHQLELALTDQALRGRRVWHGGEDDVGPGQQIVEFVRFADVGDVTVDGDVLRIDRDHGHAEGGGPLRDLGADAAEADDERRLASELDHRQLSGRVPALGHLGVEGLDVAGEVQQQGEGMVGDLGALDDLRVRQHDVAVAQVGNREEALDAGRVALDPAQLAVGDQEVLDTAVAGDQPVAVARVQVVVDPHQAQVLVLLSQIGEGIHEERRHADGDVLGGDRCGRQRDDEEAEQNPSPTRRVKIEHGRWLPVQRLLRIDRSWTKRRPIVAPGTGCAGCYDAAAFGPQISRPDPIGSKPDDHRCPP